jgi:NitT/TauT family transport system ATP-binding protein
MVLAETRDPLVGKQAVPDSSRGDASGTVAVRHVSHSFSATFAAITDVSIHVHAGQFISIVGPSGCGKTTLLNLIAGLVTVEHGSIEVSGKPPHVGSHEIAYMLARDSLLPWLDVLSNAEFGADIRGVSKAERRSKARKLLAQVGLGAFLTGYPKQLSQGMRQRVALARTFCLESPVLLMDEPFGALDAQTKLQLEDVLLSLWNDERRTVIFITHDLSEAIALSDRVLVMSARPGRLIADIPITLQRPRSVRKLQADPRYHALYGDIWSKLEQALSE